MKKYLFIDRDGTMIIEPPDYQVDSFYKFAFYPGVITWLGRIARELSFELVMVSNQDGLGTPSYPEEAFNKIQGFMLSTLEGEGIHFSKVHIDRSWPDEHKPTRKPGIDMLLEYFNDETDWQNSFVIGDRITDMALAKNLGCKGIWINQDKNLGKNEVDPHESFREAIALQTNDWQDIYSFLKGYDRVVVHNRKTNETDVHIRLNPDGSGKYNISTGIGFLDHMLEQLARHGGFDLDISVKGDLQVDEHHTVEDTAIALGEAFRQALKNKTGLERYGFSLPMDDSEAQVLIDLGGRSWLVWEVAFKREKIGELPTELIFHFFKSFSDAALCNLNIKAFGDNEHHKCEAIFKAFARALKQACHKDYDSTLMPTTKGLL